MKEFFIDLMIFAGSALMAVNIFRYVRFLRNVRRHGNWDRERRLFNLPIILLVLFLAGYLTVGLFGKPDPVIAGILFGGSIFVFVMLLLVQRTFDRIREHEHLEAKLLAAEEASKAKTFFLSNMSHDIRTPLNAIIGYTTLALQDKTPPEERGAYIRKIDRASHQLLEIVNDVLEMSRIESGRLELTPARVDLEAVVHEAADLVKTQLELKQIRFTLTCEVEHRWVRCDPVMLDRALMNLLSNAYKFTGEHGSVSLALRETACDGASGQYEIRVSDTGIGMDPGFLKHIFTPFERERTSTISKTQGTGLGMAITKNIIDQMGGRIDVQSEKGKGSEFTITLSFPLEAPEPKPSRAPLPEKAAFRGLRALLVEDNPINLEIAQLILEREGFLIETAENGRIAVDMVRDSEAGYYDVILMDIQMPEMDGYTAAAAIRALPDRARAAVPILAMTANVFQEDVQKAEDSGMNGHIAKPLNVPDMLSELEAALHADLK